MKKPTMRSALAPAPPDTPNGPPAEERVVSRGVIGHTKRWLKIVFGFILLTIGAIFGLVPLIPGWPLGILGLSILAAEFVWARRLMKRLRKQGGRMREASIFRSRKPKKPRAAADEAKA